MQFPYLAWSLFPFLHIFLCTKSRNTFNLNAHSHYLNRNESLVKELYFLENSSFFPFDIPQVDIIKLQNSIVKLDICFDVKISSKEFLELFSYRFYQLFLEFWFLFLFRIAILMTGSGCCLNVLLPDWLLFVTQASDWSMLCNTGLWLADVTCSPGDQVLYPGGLMCDHCGARILGLNTKGGQCRGNAMIETDIFRHVPKLGKV